MRIDHAKVKGLGGKIRTIGVDAQFHVQSASPVLARTGRGTDGFAAVAMLSSTLSRLSEQTALLALQARSTGEQVGSAAEAQARGLTGGSVRPQAIGGDR